MSLVVSVSGAAGTGKSTLLKNLPWKTDDFKVARHVLQSMGMDLYDILKNEELTIKFQESILSEKIINDEKLRTLEDEFIFVERCTADFYAFAATWAPRFNSPTFNDWLKDYHVRCFAAMSMYNIAIIIPPGKFAHVDDGVRAKADTQNATHKELDQFLSQRWGWANFAKPCFYFHRLESCDIIDRVNEVKTALHEATNYFDFYGELSNLRQAARLNRD